MKNTMKIPFSVSRRTLLLGRLAVIFLWVCIMRQSPASYYANLIVGVLAAFALAAGYFGKTEARVSESPAGACESPAAPGGSLSSAAKEMKAPAARRRLALMAGILVLSCVLANYSIIMDQVTVKKQVLAAAAIAVTSYVTFSSLVRGGFVLFCRLSDYGEREEAGLEKSLRSLRIVFLASWACICTVYLLYFFLCAYPGNLSTDSLMQLKQIQSGSYTNHHPYYHTLLIRLCYDLGMALFHEINAAVAVYSVFQCIAAGAVSAFCVMTVFQIGVPRWCTVLTALGYMLLPYHIVYSVTMWKDIPFALAVLLLVLTTFRIRKNMGNMRTDRVLFFIAAMGTCLWRSNGMFVFALFLLALAVRFFVRKERSSSYRTCLILAAAALLLSLILKRPVLQALDVPQPPLTEGLSIPEQQIARVIVDGKEITEEEKKLISTAIDVSKVRQTYNMHISDPIKSLAYSCGANEALRRNGPAFLKLYLSLGLRYPLEYLKAWADQTSGYWYGGYHYWAMTLDVWENDLGIVRTTRSPRLNGALQILLWGKHGVERDSVLSLLVSIGLVTWIYFLLCGYSRIRHQAGYIETLPLLLIILSLMIATPVYCEFRYAYALYTCLPFVAVSATAGSGRQDRGGW